MKNVASVRPTAPAWLLVVAGLGVAWNAFGIVQLFDFVRQTHESLMMKGMTASAADLYYGLPVWMKLAFALGSFGGLFGSGLLALLRPAAVPVLAASLIGYIALFLGDYAYGVFDVLDGQMRILIIVVAIAAALFAVSLAIRRREIGALIRRP